MRVLSRWVGAATVTAVGSLLFAAPAAAHDTAPARGAPLEDLWPAAIVAACATIAVIAVGLRHRRRPIRALSSLGSFSERVSGLPGWAAVPLGMTTASLLIAAFGFYWDVSWHIDRGRDPGPFANPAHWFIIIGLAGIALAGVMALVLADTVPSRSSVRLRDDWHAPVGGVLVTICGVIALAGFPLDDVWHRLFGQDVTLWGPTHIQMVGGASLATLALWVLAREGVRASSDAERQRAPLHRFVGSTDIFLGGAFLLGLSTLQAEFDYGVPQFRQLYQPVLIALAGSIALVAVRIRSGRGAAIGAALFFIALRAALTLGIIALGRSTLHFPLYLAEAVVVEVVALLVGTRRPLRFGAAAGVGIGTVGVAGEWLWSHVWSPLPWTAALLPWAVALALVAAVSGGLLGAMIGRALSGPEVVHAPAPRWAVVAAWLGALVCVAVPLPMHGADDLAADVTLTPAGPGTVFVRVQPRPADGVQYPNWFQVIAWQGAGDGDGGLVLADLHADGEGGYTTTEAVPVTGPWKTMIRLQQDRAVVSLPIYLPEDPDIPAAGVTADPTFRRGFVPDKAILQREAVGGSPELQDVAYLLIALIALVWLGSLAWGIRRLERAEIDAPRSDVARVAPDPEENRPAVASSRRSGPSASRPMH